MKPSRFTGFAWGVLGFNILVILWGAYVRASISGDGCGSHWPLCNGQVIPIAPRIETIIEFTHRMMSGAALLLVAGLLVWAFRSFPKQHPVRLGAVLSAVLILTEAAVGAGLVLFQWVAHDTSAARVISQAVHLINTFLLLGALTLTAWWASPGLSGERPVRLHGQGAVAWGLLGGLLAVMFLGVSGAINALGDTLYPVSSLAEGLRQDFSPAASLLLRLRVWHPVIAAASGLYLLYLGGWIVGRRAHAIVRPAFLALAALTLLQLVAGVVNILLLAPTWMQILHLLLADLVWIALVLLSAATLTDLPKLAPQTAPAPVQSGLRT